MALSEPRHEYQRRVIAHGERALATGMALAELRKTLRG
jgi:hypothetical protein